MRTVRMTLDNDPVKAIDKAVKKLNTSPVLILTRTSAIEYFAEAAVAPVTTTVRDIPSEVPSSREDGIPRDCAVDPDLVHPVP